MFNKYSLGNWPTVDSVSLSSGLPKDLLFTRITLCPGSAQHSASDTALFLLSIAEASTNVVFSPHLDMRWSIELGVRLFENTEVHFVC